MRTVRLRQPYSIIARVVLVPVMDPMPDIIHWKGKDFIRETDEEYREATAFDALDKP